MENLKSYFGCVCISEKVHVLCAVLCCALTMEISINFNFAETLIFSWWILWVFCVKNHRKLKWDFCCNIRLIEINSPRLEQDKISNPQFLFSRSNIEMLYFYHFRRTRRSQLISPIKGRQNILSMFKLKYTLQSDITNVKLNLEFKILSGPDT